MYGSKVQIQLRDRATNINVGLQLVVWQSCFTMIKLAKLNL